MFGVTGHEQEIVDLFEGFNIDWCNPLSADLVVDGVTVTNDEYPLGCLNDEFGPVLEAMGVSYTGEQSAIYEYAAEVRMFAPDLGVFLSDSNGEGVPLVSSQAINDAIRDYESTPVGTKFLALAEAAAALVLRLEKLSGKTHTIRFASLREQTA
jgi:hypothetical protein